MDGILKMVSPKPDLGVRYTIKNTFLTVEVPAIIFTLLSFLVYALLGNPLTPGTPYGYMRYVQLEAYSRAVWGLEGSPTYCEVGFNGGHSVAAMLLAHPRMKAVSFELGDRPYTAEAVRQLRLYFGADRFDYRVGNSRVTVPAYASTPGYSMCDVILVDGDHSKEGAYTDIVNMNTLAKPGAKLFIDASNRGYMNRNAMPSLAYADASLGSRSMGAAGANLFRNAW